MTRCEDFPCCGHAVGDCPNEDGTFNCVECGSKLSRHARSSICTDCQSSWSRMSDEEREWRLERQDEYDMMWG